MRSFVRKLRIRIDFRDQFFAQIFRRTPQPFQKLEPNFAFLFSQFYFSHPSCLPVAIAFANEVPRSKSPRSAENPPFGIHFAKNFLNLKCENFRVPKDFFTAAELLRFAAVLTAIRKNRIN